MVNILSQETKAEDRIHLENEIELSTPTLVGAPYRGFTSPEVNARNMNLSSVLTTVNAMNSKYGTNGRLELGRNPMHNIVCKGNLQRNPKNPDYTFANCSMNGQPVMNTTPHRYDEYLEYDTEITRIFRENLRLVKDLSSVKKSISGKGVTEIRRLSSSDLIGATMTIDFSEAPSNDLVDYHETIIPLPVHQKTIKVPVRLSDHRNKFSGSIIQDNLEVATRRVADSIEQMAWVGTNGVSLGGNIMYGYGNFPQSNIVTEINPDWSTATGTEIYASILAMKQALVNDNIFDDSLYTLYYSKDYETVLDREFSAEYPKTIATKIAEARGFSSDRIRPIHLPNQDLTRTVFLTSIQRKYIDFPDYNGIQWVEYQRTPIDPVEFCVYSICAIRIKTDYNGNCALALRERATS